MSLGIFMPISPFIEAWEKHYSGQVVHTKREAYVFYLSLLTYLNLNLCNGNKTALMLSNWLPCIIFVLGLRMQLKFKKRQIKKSDFCTFFWFRWLRGTFSVTEILYTWQNHVLWWEGFSMIPHYGKEVGTMKDHFLLLLSLVQVYVMRTSSYTKALSRKCCPYSVPHWFHHMRGRVVSLNNNSA